jgi:hypothetical protein
MNALTDLVIAWSKSFAVVNAVKILGVDHLLAFIGIACRFRVFSSAIWPMKSTLTTVCRQPYDVKRKETSSVEETCILNQTFARVLIFDAVPRVVCERWSASDGLRAMAT